MEGDPNVGSSSSSAIKKRRRPSEVWNEMIKCKDGKAKCMHCGRLFDGSSKKGTTHLKNHLGRCPAKKRKGPGGDDQDQSLSPSVKTKELASLIRKKSLVGLIKHFNTERDTSDEDFEHLSDTEGDSSDEEWEAWDDLDPGLLYSRKDEILQLYQEEKEKLCQFLNNLSCRFSLGLVPYDFDYGEAPVGYFLVVYYIDDSCKEVMNDVIDRFFSKYYLVRVIALILDPRFKMDGVQLHYKEIYGSDADRYIERVNKDFRDVYDAYAATDSSNSKSYEMLDARGRPSSPKSELDRYFNLLKVPRDHQLDVLAWWRGNAPFYPTLARMARDYLALKEKLLFLDNEVVPDDVIDMADQIAGFDLEERGLGEIISPLVCLKGFLGTAEN